MKALQSYSNLSSQLLAEQLIQFIVRRPRTFILVFGSGPAVVAIWLFIASIQSGEWIWTSMAGAWLASISTSIGGLCYLLSNSRSREIDY